MLAVYVKYWEEYKTGSTCLNHLYVYELYEFRKKNFISPSNYLIRYLNTHHVKRRQINDADNNYGSLDSTNDNSELPLVEVGEVS